MANATSILKMLGIGAAGAGMSAANIMTGGALTPLTDTLTSLIKSKLPDPALAAQLDQAKLQANEDLQKAELAYTQQVITSVNATMQAEAASPSVFEHWRGGLGWVAGLYFINNFVLIPWFHKYGLVPIVLPPEAWIFLSAVLGISAWHQGQTDLESARNSNGNGK